MLMNNDEIIADFRRRYEGTFVQVCAEQKNIKVLGKMMRVRADAEKFATLEIATREFGTIAMNMGSEEYQVKFEFPPSGVFQFAGMAIAVRRKAEKQYARGLCAGNCALVPTTANITGGAVSFGLNEVQAAYDHKTHTLGQAYTMFKLGQAKSVALRDNFSIALPMSAEKKHYYLFHNYALVGALDEEGKLVRVMEPVYEKAIAELLNGNQ
jgi:hypothetical protein